MTSIFLPRRRPLHLPGYDYAQAGAYFVTVCTRAREPLLGQVVAGEVVLSPFGQIADAVWRWLGEQYAYVVIDTYVVMPNHLHGILWIVDDPVSAAGGLGGCLRSGRSRTTATQTPLPNETKRKPLGRLIGAFKTVSTKQINLLRSTPGAAFWQRNYYEHIIRGERALERIRRYIRSNPARWEYDHENPSRLHPLTRTK